jgi:hypothetical protein
MGALKIKFVDKKENKNKNFFKCLYMPICINMHIWH